MIKRKEATIVEQETYTFTKKELQTLINIVFEMVYSTGERFSGNYTPFRDREMEWVADNLRQVGINTTPRGISWGVLVD